MSVTGSNAIQPLVRGDPARLVTMSIPLDDTRTPTGKNPQLGPVFQGLTLGASAAILVSETGLMIAGVSVGEANPGLFATLWGLCVLFAVIAGLRDRFRPGPAVPWLMLGAFLIAVMIASASGTGDGGLRIPLLFETGTAANGVTYVAIPLLDTFRSLPATFLLTLSDVAFWALAIAWVLTLVRWRRAPKPRRDDGRGGLRSVGPRAE